jgi:hypothetical protein
VITPSSNITRLHNEAIALRNRPEFSGSGLTELTSTSFESWAKERFEIATKIAYLNGAVPGTPKGSLKDCSDVDAAVFPVGYSTIAGRIGELRIVLAGYRLAEILKRLVGV